MLAFASPFARTELSKVVALLNSIETDPETRTTGGKPTQPPQKKPKKDPGAMTQDSILTQVRALAAAGAAGKGDSEAED